MPRSKIVEARDLAIGETINLNDHEGFHVFRAFYVECDYLNEQYELPLETRHVGQILEITETEDELHFKVLATDGRTLEIEVTPNQKFSVNTPEIVEISKIEKGDKILMRGDLNPAHSTKGHDYALISLKHGYSSTVLRVRKRRRGDYKLVVLFANVKKLRCTVEAGSIFELSYSLE